MELAYKILFCGAALAFLLVALAVVIGPWLMISSVYDEEDE